MKALLCLSLPICLCISLASAQHIWRESTFEDFQDGSFSDSGVNTYVSSNGRIQTINRWDVNNDGYTDLLFSNAHSQAVQLDMSIYWGNGRDFSILNHSYVPAWGPEWVAAEDLDRDGRVDLVVANIEDGSTDDMDSFVYYGGLRDSGDARNSGEWAVYPFKRRLILPNEGARKPAVGDLNRDGSLDLVFATRQEARIFWGKNQGQFDPGIYTDLPTTNATDVAVADLNNDQWPEIIFTKLGNTSFIYWSDGGSFSADHRSQLLTNDAYAVEVADVNDDGASDLLLANGKGGKSWALLSENGSFDPARRIEFETHSARDCVVADFNKDGWSDVFFTNHDVNGNRITDSFLYYGSEDGFSGDRRHDLRTIGGWAASAGDLNEDGWPDLLVSNFQEHNSFEIPSFIYWNSAKGFDVSLRTNLHQRGAKGNAIADLNNDGHLDVLIVNTRTHAINEYHPNFLYFGSEKGDYSVDNRLELMGLMSQWGAMADMNDDGQVDIVFSNYHQGPLHRWGYQDLFVYWNENNSFDFDRRTALPIYRVHGGLLINDLDKDGYLDVFAGQERVYPDAEKNNVPTGSLIYWGGPDGWVVHQRSVVPFVGSRMPAVADLDRDGRLDLIFGQTRADQTGAIFFNNGTRQVDRWRLQRVEGTKKSQQLQVADLNKDGLLDIVFTYGGKTDDFFHIYYGDEKALYGVENRVLVKGALAKTMAVADVNSDGWLDLLCSDYWHPSKPLGRDGESHILLGGPEGYSFDRKISLPTRGADGTLVSDLNYDGYTDILWFNHRADGRFDEIGKPNLHIIDSYLYWGGPGGFDRERRLGIPGRGVHYRETSDELGDIYNRECRFDYVSSPYNSQGRKPFRINWAAQEPHRSSVRFQVRLSESESALADAPWVGASGEGSHFTERNTSLSHLGEGNWIQYRAILDTFNCAYSPILESVEIMFE